jgi:hypothetical protein
MAKGAELAQYTLLSKSRTLQPVYKVEPDDPSVLAGSFPAGEAGLGVKKDSSTSPGRGRAVLRTIGHLEAQKGFGPGSAAKLIISSG